jgi:hypothetical protein
MTDLTTASAIALARRRLDRLAAIDREYGARLNPRGIRLLRHATFAAYTVLRDLEETLDDRDAS